MAKIMDTDYLDAAIEDDELMLSDTIDGEAIRLGENDYGRAVRCSSLGAGNSSARSTENRNYLRYFFIIC